MELSLAKEQKSAHITGADATVLLFDTPDNLGVDFLQLLQKLGINFVSERVNEKEALFNALKTQNWDMLLVCDQVDEQIQEAAQVFIGQLACETGLVLLNTSTLTIEQLTSAYQKGLSAVVSSAHPEYSLEVFVRAAERSRSNFHLRQLNQEKVDLRRHCEQLASGTEEALAYLQDGIHIFSNDAYLNLLGYSSVDDLLVTPFIDVIATELQEEIKQKLSDFQHKLLKHPDTEPLQLDEIFIQGIGESEGILQVSAVFKPAVHDGEECIQLILKKLREAEVKEDAGVSVEGLGYPLFINHLQNYVGEAINSNKLMGHVVHINGRGFEHYIANKGFGSLNSKLKQLASELKKLVSKEDLLIRFSGNSFLILLKECADKEAENNPVIKSINTLLDKFEEIFNAEVGGDEFEIIELSASVIAVDGQSGSAEALVKSFLLGESERGDKAESSAKKQKDNIIPFADKAAAPEEEAAHKAASAQQTESEPEQIIEQVSGTQAAEENAESSLQNAAKQLAPTSSAVLISENQLSDALLNNGISLFCDTVISVIDIETELYAISAYVDGFDEAVTRRNMADDVVHSSLPHKFDMWMLQHTVDVVGELYKQGLEYRILLSLSPASLLEKKLAELIQTEISRLSLPPEMLVLDFPVEDICADLDASKKQFEKLSEAGFQLSISDIEDVSTIDDLVGNTNVSLVSLANTFIENAALDDSEFKLLVERVESLQNKKFKVVASDIHSNELLNMCCKAKVDLVKGKHIQNNPLPLSEDSLVQEMLI